MHYFINKSFNVILLNLLKQFSITNTPYVNSSDIICLSANVLGGLCYQWLLDGTCVLFKCWGNHRTLNLKAPQRIATILTLLGNMKDLCKAFLENLPIPYSSYGHIAMAGLTITGTCFHIKHIVTPLT